MDDSGVRATTSFMRQLKKMFEEVPHIVWWDRGAIVIGDRAALERVLPRYYRTSKFSSFQRQLNNFGYHRSYDRGNNWRGVCYCKVVGEPASDDVDCLLSLRPLVRRTKKRHDEDDERAVKRPAVWQANDEWIDSRQVASACAAFDQPASPTPCKENFDDDVLLTPSLAAAAHCLLSMGAAAA